MGAGKVEEKVEGASGEEDISASTDNDFEVALGKVAASGGTMEEYIENWNAKRQSMIDAGVLHPQDGLKDPALGKVAASGGTMEEYIENWNAKRQNMIDAGVLDPQDGPKKRTTLGAKRSAN